MYVSQLFSPYPPTGKFCTVSEFNYPDKKWPPGRKAYLVKLGLKSFVDGRQDICKDKKNLICDQLLAAKAEII